MEEFRGLYRAWKSLIQSSEDEEEVKDEEGVEETKEGDVDFLCFCLKNFGLFSLKFGILRASVKL